MRCDPLYSIERMPLGWLVCGQSGQSGIPISALNECLPAFPKDGVIDPGIVHHFRQTGKDNARLCIVTKENGVLWRQEIEASLANCEPEKRWWFGTDVGRSSAAIFAVFCKSFSFRVEALDYGKGSTPQDAADFGRCRWLLDRFPEWRAKLSRVAEAYPDTAWPKIISHWPELESTTPEQQNKILFHQNANHQPETLP